MVLIDNGALAERYSSVVGRLFLCLNAIGSFYTQFYFTICRSKVLYNVNRHVKNRQKLD